MQIFLLQKLRRKELHWRKKYGTIGISMQEELKNTPDIDPSGMFSTYKAQSSNTNAVNGVVWSPYPISPYPLSSQKKDQDHNNEPVMIRSLRIIIEGVVRIIKISVWCIAIFGALFITALATNTIDRAVEILNANIGTNISISGEVVVVKPPKVPQKTPWITSNAITTPSTADNTPESVASKRRAILEARKAAKILEEKQKALEQVSK